MYFFRSFSILAFIFVFSFLLSSPVKADALVNRLSGKILLQVEAAGEAWYLNPVDAKRYYLGRPSDAFALMRSLGLGINETSYNLFKTKGAANFRGRILLRVESLGQAYYVNPDDNKLYYLGRPSDAFVLMRQLGLGISNSNLALISPAVTNINNEVNPLAGVNLKEYKWRYQNQNYSLKLALSDKLYEKYNQSPKVYSYYLGQEPTDFRESFYAMFLETKEEDSQTKAVLDNLKAKANGLGLSPDESVSFIMSFIQYLNYDHTKAGLTDIKQNYPFETLYLQKGICSDTSFLAVLWLRELGYGAAILDFPDSNHSAAGIACPLADSLNSSGYCYLETTSYFPIGVVPSLTSSGQAQDQSYNFTKLFSVQDLGKMEIRQATKGKLYQGMELVKQEVASLSQMKLELDNSKLKLDDENKKIEDAYASLSQKMALLQAYKDQGNFEAYNQLVLIYNQEVSSYQAQEAIYLEMVKNYNQASLAFSERYKSFYQQ